MPHYATVLEVRSLRRALAVDFAESPKRAEEDLAARITQGRITDNWLGTYGDVLEFPDQKSIKVVLGPVNVPHPDRTAAEVWDKKVKAALAKAGERKPKGVT